MEINVKVTRTAEQLAALEPDTGKVYVFIEPTPQIIALFPGIVPDEHQGAHCVSVTLENEAAVDQAKALTDLALLAEAGEDEDR